MTRLHLPDVTLVCVDTRTPALALDAMRLSVTQVEFGRVIMFTDAATIAALPPDIEGIEVAIESIDAYSVFMMRGLAQYVTTSHLLVIQWDGFVLDPAQWDPAFLQFDYIGALLKGETGDRMVGNGGFSLRSRRLLNAMLDPAIVVENPEDTCICHVNREHLERGHGIRFASSEIAARFSFERIRSRGSTFGFHGLYNMPRVLSIDAMEALVRRMPDGMSLGVDARDLCQNLIAGGQLTAARELIAKRRSLGPLHARTLRLRFRYLMARLGQLYRNGIRQPA